MFLKHLLCSSADAWINSWKWSLNLDTKLPFPDLFLWQNETLCAGLTCSFSSIWLLFESILNKITTKTTSVSFLVRIRCYTKGVNMKSFKVQTDIFTNTFHASLISKLQSSNLPMNFTFSINKLLRNITLNFSYWLQEKRIVKIGGKKCKRNSENLLWVCDTRAQET